MALVLAASDKRFISKRTGSLRAIPQYTVCGVRPNYTSRLCRSCARRSNVASSSRCSSELQSTTNFNRGTCLQSHVCNGVRK